MMLAWAIGDAIENPDIFWGPTVAQPAVLGEPYKVGERKGQPRVLVPAIEVPKPDLDELTGLPVCPPSLVKAIADGLIFEAHNAEFERAVWTCICVRKWGWPQIPIRQWRCSAAKGAAYALPRDLERLAKVLSVKHQKDVGEGSNALKSLYKPRDPTKDNPRRWPGDTATFLRCAEYNKQDVRAEYDVSKELPDLIPFEWEIWFVDQEMNERGVKIDMELAEAAMRLAEDAKHVMNTELRELMQDPTVTGGARDRIKQHLDLAYKELDDLQGETLDKVLEDPEISSHVRRVVELVRDINRTTTSKYKKAVARCLEDHLARSNLMYWGAQTGRWSGKGLQLHNLKRPGKPHENYRTAKGKLDMDKLAADIKLMSVDELMRLSDMPINFLSDVIRGLIIPRMGYELAVGDYAAVEARGVMWLADCQIALDIFASGKDIYLDIAMEIYRRHLTKADEKERQLGKQAILGLGYGMGAVKFLETCAKYKIFFTEEMARALVPEADWAELEELFRDPKQAAIYAPGYFISEETLPPLIMAKYIVDRYRGKYDEVKKTWREVENAAIAALQKPGQWVPCCNKKLHWKKVGNFLFCRLPSARMLSYPFAYLKMEETKFKDRNGDPVFKPTIRYYAVDGLTKQWGKTHTYGGALVENIVQGICRDLMAYAMVECHRTGKYHPILTVHDELIAEVLRSKGDAKEFEKIMEQLPPWAAGFPLKSEADILHRYRK
jgi:DNA polymerase